MARGIAVGVDGVTVTGAELRGRTLRVTMDNPLAALPLPYELPWEIDLRVVGLPAGGHELVVNDGPPARLAAEAGRPATVRLRVQGSTIVAVDGPPPR